MEVLFNTLIIDDKITINFIYWNRKRIFSARHYKLTPLPWKKIYRKQYFLISIFSLHKGTVRVISSDLQQSSLIFLFVYWFQRYMCVNLSKTPWILLKTVVCYIRTVWIRSSSVTCVPRNKITEYFTFKSKNFFYLISRK